MKKTYLLTLLVLFIAFSSNLTAQINLKQGLSAYYPFNGNANDSSGNGNHGQIMGAPTLARDKWGKTNNCFNFNGNGDYIRVTKNSTIEPPIGLSISAWVYCEDFTSWNVVASKRAAHNADPYNSYILYGSGSAGQSQKWGFIISTGQHTSYDVIDGSVLQTAKWVHLVGTYDSSTSGGSNLKLYVDGQVVSSKKVTGTIYYTDSSLRIGMAIPGPSLQYFKGKIDEVRIYNRALNDQEVTALYNNILNTSVKSVSGVTNTVDVFPNPANDRLFVSGDYQYINIHLELYDVTGKLILTKPVEASGSVSISELPAGLYITKVIDSVTGNLLSSQRISVE